jgi:long-chain acyl-CoA synthetase
VGDVDHETLRATARERLAPPKRPKDYVTVDALPVTATGKVRRLALPGLLGLEVSE